MNLMTWALPTAIVVLGIGWYLTEESTTFQGGEMISVADLDDHISSGSVDINNAYATFPISDNILTTFLESHPESHLRFSISHDGNAMGFRQFCRNETTIMVGNRPINDEELYSCNNNEIRFIEVPIALDAIVLATNRNNNVRSMGIDTIRTLWVESNPNVTNWYNLRTSWGDRPIDIFGPNLESIEAEKFSFMLFDGIENSHLRSDYTQLNRYDEIISNISTNRNAITYMSRAQFNENSADIRTIAIDNVTPSADNIISGEYPFEIYLIMYVNANAIRNGEVLDFVSYYMDNMTGRIDELGYIPLPRNTQTFYRGRIYNDITGSAFWGRGQEHISVNDLMNRPLCCSSAYNMLTRSQRLLHLGETNHEE